MSKERRDTGPPFPPAPTIERTLAFRAAAGDAALAVKAAVVEVFGGVRDDDDDDDGLTAEDRGAKASQPAFAGEGGAGGSFCSGVGGLWMGDGGCKP